MKQMPGVCPGGMFAVGIDSHITLVFGSARNLYNTNTFCFAENPGCFQLLQTIQTHYGMAVTSFQLKDALLIAFANYQEGKFFYKTKLPVYVLQQNTFTLNQTRLIRCPRCRIFYNQFPAFPDYGKQIRWP